MPTIKEWTNNKTILITGGAGFFGKVLTEKLLRACPGVDRIYLIIRSKHGKTPQERWDDISKDVLFEPVLAKVPDIMKKVTVLDGDMSLINLGLSEENIEELKSRVNIIFHTAATVRFNDPLHKAFLSNTRGTLEMCKLASETKNLDVFVHVSTAYCNHNLKKTYYEEKIYEPCQDWRTILKLIEEDPLVMNTISYKILQDHPNTYTFSKSLSEKIVEEYSCKFPTVLSRPPVVVGIYQDPVPGWTDNVNGLMGITTGMCKGVLRVIKCRGDCCLDYIPVDVSVNALIVGGWEKATSDNKELSIYNCGYGDLVPISFENILVDGSELNKKILPLDNDIWYPFLIFVQNDFYFHLLFYLLQVLPAVIIDLILFLMKKERRLVKITIKIYQALQALAAFTNSNVSFDNKKYHDLWEKLKGDEAEIFRVGLPENFNWSEAMKYMHLGVKKYFLKEKTEDIEYHRIKLMRLYYLDRFVRGILIITAFTLSYKLINFVLHKYIL